MVHFQEEQLDGLYKLCKMAQRYWIGNGGNINDTAHWSDSFGGTGGFSVPTIADDVNFSSLSFTITGQTVTFNIAFECNNLDVDSGTLHSPIFSLNDVLTVNNHLSVSAGTLDSNGFLIIAASFLLGLNATCESGGFEIDQLETSISNVWQVFGTFISNNTAILINYIGSGDFSVNFVDQTNTAYGAILIVGNGIDLYTVNFSTISDLSFDSFEIERLVALTFLHTRTFTINSDLTLDGSSGQISLESTLIDGTTFSAGFTFNVSGNVDVSHTTVHGIIGAGNIPFFDYPGGVDNGDNVNWIFGPSSPEGWYYGDNNVIYQVAS